MALTPIEVIKRGTTGGGGIGSVIGGAVGGIVGTIIPGVGTAAGLAAGSAAGGAIGALASPGKAASQGFQGAQSAIARRLGDQPPDDSAVLGQSLAALKEAPKDLADAYTEPLQKAYDLAQQKRRPGGMV